jgi:hypothetical protein
MLFVFFSSGLQDAKVISRARIESRAAPKPHDERSPLSEVGSPLALRSDCERMTDNTEVSSAV